MHCDSGNRVLPYLGIHLVIWMPMMLTTGQHVFLVVGTIVAFALIAFGLCR